MSLVVLDADKEEALRGKTALVQTIGRAARNTAGKVLMYADKRTEAIVGALEETNRARAYQVSYNEEHGITPETIVKGVSGISELLSLRSPHVPTSRRRHGKTEVEGCPATSSEKLVITFRGGDVPCRRGSLRVRGEAPRRGQGAAAGPSRACRRSLTRREELDFGVVAASLREVGVAGNQWRAECLGEDDAARRERSSYREDPTLAP